MAAFRVRLFLSLALFCLAASPAYSHFGGVECLAPLLRDPNPTTALNSFMSAKYPKLAKVVKDPDAFLVEMRGRFNEYKKLHPDSPHGFDYSELGLPLVRDLAANLDKKIEELTGFRGSRIGDAERMVGLQYLKDLKAESDAILKEGAVGYRKLIEFSYFYSRAIGHFDTRFYRPSQRLFLKVDRVIEGYGQLSIEEEYTLYRLRKFEVFQLKSASTGFNLSSKPFETAFLNKSELKQVWVPTNAVLERDIFMRMMFKDIHFVGVTYDPIMADGFLRPGGDFWMHDLRHEAAKYFEKWRYIAEKNLSEEQVSSIDAKVDQWALDLSAAMSKVQDHDLQEAVELIAFSYHHDRGFPLIPSVYLNRRRDGFEHALYMMMKVSGQGVAFEMPIYNLERAHAWLTKFWTNRLPQEKEILDRF